MKFICFNMYLNSALLDKKLSNQFLKTLAYESKTKNSQTKIITYRKVLLELLNLPSTDILDSKLIEFACTHMVDNKYTGKDNEQKKIIYSLYNLLSSITNLKFTIDFLGVIDDSDMNIFYTDGSSSKKTNLAGYASVQLLEKSKKKDALYDDFTKSKYNYKSFSGKIESGTNNIGELTGIKTAIDISGDKKVQVIISDSMYSINSFREWIYNWKDNGYKNSSNEIIANVDIIKYIYNAIHDSPKLYVFKWTKGHADTEFNDLCDSLAKKQTGVE